MLVQLSITCAGSSLSTVGSMAVTEQRQVSLATDEVTHPIQWRDRVGITPTSLLSRTPFAGSLRFLANCGAVALSYSVVI